MSYLYSLAGFTDLWLQLLHVGSTPTRPYVLRLPHLPTPDYVSDSVGLSLTLPYSARLPRVLTY